MIKMKTKDTITFGDKNKPDFYLKLEDQKEYILNNDLFRLINNIKKEAIDHHEEISNINTIPVQKAKKILLVRTGGIGDIVFTFPHIDAIKKENPKAQLDFATAPRNLAVLKLNKNIDNLLSEPLEYSKVFPEYDYVLFLENFIENNPESMKVNAFDLAQKQLGIERVELKPIKVPKLKENDLIHIFISYSSSVKIRDINPSIWWQFLINLDPKKFKVSIAGVEEQAKDILTVINKVKEFNQSLVVQPYIGHYLEKIIDLFLEDQPQIVMGPDSGIINLAGYIGIPIIGLFGPFHSKLRIKYYNYAIGIDVESKCPFGLNSFGNCFQHGVGNCKLAQFRNELYSPCLQKINPYYIHKAINTIVDDYKSGVIQGS